MKKANVLWMIVLVVVLGVGALAYNGQLLQGSFKSTTAVKISKLPDLVAGPTLGTTFVVTGKGVVDTSGHVISFSGTKDFTCSISNMGSATASGMSYSRCDFMYSSSFALADIVSASTLSLAAGASLSFSDTSTLSISPTTSRTYEEYLFVQALHDKGSYTSSVNYQVDYATTKYIAESNETNNNSTQSTVIDGSGIIWAVAP